MAAATFSGIRARPQDYRCFPKNSLTAKARYKALYDVLFPGYKTARCGQEDVERNKPSSPHRYPDTVFIIARFLVPSRISHDSHNKVRSFPYRALTDCHRNDKIMCVSCVYLGERMGSSLNNCGRIPIKEQKKYDSLNLNSSAATLGAQ